MFTPEQKTAIKTQFKLLINTTMEFCIVSPETQIETQNTFAMFESMLGRILTDEEKEWLSFNYAGWAKNVICPYDATSMEIEWENIFNNLNTKFNG